MLPRPESRLVVEGSMLRVVSVRLQQWETRVLPRYRLTVFLRIIG